MAARSTPGFEALRRRAEREQSHPDSRAIRAPAPPGLEGEAFAPVDASDTDARRTLDAVTQSLAESGLGGAAPRPAEAAEPDAVRRYIAARQSLLAGDAAGAERELAGAVRLDPLAPELWRSLGEARQAAGNSAGALAAFREALRRDPRDAASLETLGRAAVRARDYRAGAEMLSRLWAAGSQGADPVSRYLVALDLGASLHRLGYLSAGAEALEEAVSVPEPFPAQTRQWEELGALYRARAGALRDIGDARARLGRFDLALLAYERAAAQPSLDAGASVSARRTGAAMRLGQPARAALGALDDIRRSGGRPDDARISALRHIAAHSGAGPELARALAELESEADDRTRTLGASAFARARAACLDGPEALDALRARLRVAPSDTAALSAMLERLGPTRLGVGLREAAALVDASPDTEPDVTAALLRAASPEALLNAWSALPADARATPAARLLHARALAAVDPGAAEDELESLGAAAPAYAPGVAARVQTLALLGRWAEARAVADTLGAEAPWDGVARARMLRTLGDDAGALEALRPAIDGPGAPFAPAALGASLAADMGDGALAERLWRAAVASDPAREEGYAGLISLYAAAQGAETDTRLSDVIRALREASPGARTLRVLLARELAAAGQHDRAERELLDIAEQDPADAEAVGLLTSVWLATGSGDRACEWLGAKRDANPHTPCLTAEYARALAAVGRGREGEAMLRAWLEQRPGDVAASRRLEAILRAELADPAGADAIAIARLESAPRTTATAIELAEVLAGANRWAEAAEAIASVPVGPRLRPAQVDRAARLALAAAAPATEGSPRWDVARDAGRLAALTALAARTPSLAPEVHARRIELLALSGSALADVRAGVQDAASQRPAIADDIALVALDALREAGRRADSLALAKAFSLERRPVRPAIGAAWVSLAVIAGDAGAAEEGVRAIVADRRSAEALDAMARMRRGRLVGDGAPSELAYEVGAMFAADEHDDAADRLWRVALEFDPRHAMANNNIGFRLADRGERLLEAHAMLVIAHEEEPEEAAITDSLAWVRYKLGIFEDRPGVDGGPPLEGALTLLRRATKLEGAEGAEPEILDHLGDAAWAAGHKDEARASWRRAVEITTRIVSSNRGRADLNDRQRAALERMKEFITTTGAKALTPEGQEPAISPVIGGGDALLLAPAPPPGADAGPAT